MENAPGITLLGLGLVLLGAFLAHVIGARMHVPRVTLLLLLGIATGPVGLDLVPVALQQAFPFIAAMALAMVGFLLGEQFAGREVKRTGRAIVWVSAAVTLCTAVFVFGALLAVGAPLAVALLLAGIAPATAPAATIDIIRELKARGPLTTIVLGVVALDDVLGVMLFSVVLAIASGVAGAGAGPALGSTLLSGLWEIVGAVLVGVLLGLPMAALTGRLRPGEPAVAEVMGFVFLCAGLASAVEASYLLACMVLGATVANRARHHTRPFHMIQGIADPFLALFFVLAGVQLEVIGLAEVGILGGIYIVARTAGRLIGGNIGGHLGGADPVVRSRVGWCLLPQAGVSVGLALLAAIRLPDAGGIVLRLVLATTVVLEIAAPVVTRWHLTRAGEVGHASQG